MAGKMVGGEAKKFRTEEGKEGGEREEGWIKDRGGDGGFEKGEEERRQGGEGCWGGERVERRRGRKGKKGEKEEGKITKGEREEDSWWKYVEEEEMEEEEGERELWKKLEDRIERKKRKEEERERERVAREKLEEQVRRERRSRNLVWRGIEEDSFEERCRLLKLLLERLLERILGRKVELRGVEKRIGEGGKRILLVIMEEKKDRNEILEKRREIGRRWRMEVDEDLTREE
ncbi:hypothetical protein RF55_17397, partial [Lasius niger]